MPIVPAADEREPYAEDLMTWLGGFFGEASVASHSHARFQYDIKRRAIRFPLQLATPPPCDAEVRGIALRLPTKPHGADAVRLTLGGDNLYAEVIGAGTIEFSTYSLYRHVNLAVAVLDNFVKESAS